MLALKLLAGVCLGLHLAGAIASGGEMSTSTFFSLPRNERADKFEALDLPVQYKLYLHGVRNIEPPALELGTRIAKRGKDAVPFLSGILQAASSGLDVRDAIYVLYAMDGLGLYRVKNDKELVANMEQSIERMGEEPWRESSIKMVDQMMGR
jgi:hypothetical protein